MFEYFPERPYTYNLSVVATLNSGGLIDEVDRACRPITDAAAAGEDAGHAGLPAGLDRRSPTSSSARPRTAEKAGHIRTAGQLYFRASNYLAQAERMLAHSDPNRVPTYKRMLELAQKAFDLHSPRVSRVEIPYEGTTLPAYFSQAPATDDGPAPVIVLVNGLDSTKEHMYASNHWEELAARGISCLMLDQPGTGEALRLQGLTARIDTEAWGGAAVDYLETRDDVDAAPDRHRRLVARRLLRPAGRGVREAVRALRRLGRQPQLGRRAAPPRGARGRAPGPALLGARALGLGPGGRRAPPRRVPRLRRRRPPRRRRREHHRAVPDRARRQRPADPAGVRAPLLRAGGQLAQAGAAGVHARGGRDRAHRPGPPALRQHLHRRLGGRHLRRARSADHDRDP